MKREIIPTADGSHTVQVQELHATYHSKHGAVQESMHVFIKEGLHYFIQVSGRKNISILEMGFGTGLNTLLTLIEADKLKVHIRYTAIELYPLTAEEVKQLNYSSLFPQQTEVFEKMHAAPWNEEHTITDLFTLKKEKADLLQYAPEQQFAIIYYDAFAPSAQPNLWTEAVFKKLYASLHPGGILVTYCSKGDVRRAMQAAGFAVEKRPGPPGKREMVRSHVAAAITSPPSSSRHPSHPSV